MNSDKKPTDRYFRYLDQTQSEIVLAEGIRHGYADLFAVNTSANKLSKSDVINKFRTLSQGAYSESVLDKMGLTFSELVKLADFEAKPSRDVPQHRKSLRLFRKTPMHQLDDSSKIDMGGLHYNIR